MYALIIGLLSFGLGVMLGVVFGCAAMYKAFEAEIKQGYVQLGKGQLFRVVKATVQ